MKLSLVLLALVTLSPIAKADLAFPVRNAETINLQGADALNLYDTLAVQAVTEAALRTSVTTVKVFYSQMGTTQIVCHKTVVRFQNQANGQCKIEKSTNGQALPKYRIRRIMG
jgi:hypothetical protein